MDGWLSRVLRLRMQDTGLVSDVAGLDEQFHNVEGGVGHAGAKDKSLILGEAVHPLQQPVSVSMLIHQQYRCFWFKRHTRVSKNFRPPPARGAQESPGPILKNKGSPLAQGKKGKRTKG